MSYDSLKILIAEDNKLNQKIALWQLGKYSPNIDIAENGRIAVEKFLNGSYDLILMDLHMPELDGFEATLKIRQIEEAEKRKQTKIVAMTASSPSDFRDLCHEIGMDGYISKPFRPEEVLSQFA